MQVTRLPSGSADIARHAPNWPSITKEPPFLRCFRPAKPSGALNMGRLQRGASGRRFGQFYGFGRALLAAAQRPLSCQPISYSGNCADEALALRMIEMSQRANHSGALSATTILLGVDDLGSVLQAVQSLASALALCGLFVRSPLEGHERPLS
jgi:hypothetical protein